MSLNSEDEWENEEYKCTVYNIQCTYMTPFAVANVFFSSLFLVLHRICVRFSTDLAADVVVVMHA